MKSCLDCANSDKTIEGLIVCHAMEFDAKGKKIHDRRTVSAHSARSDNGICRQEAILFKPFEEYIPETINEDPVDETAEYAVEAKPKKAPAKRKPRKQS